MSSLLYITTQPPEIKGVYIDVTVKSNAKEE